MILASINDRWRYYCLHPKMRMLWDFVMSNDFSSMPPSHVCIDGDSLFVNLDESRLRPRMERLLEVHRRYVDVQIPLTAGETIGWRSLSGIKAASLQPYDAARDIAFYDVEPQSFVDVSPGQFCVFFPDDAHAPLIGSGVTRKLVGKLLLP